MTQTFRFLRAALVPTWRLAILAVLVVLTWQVILLSGDLKALRAESAWRFFKAHPDISGFE